MGTYCTLYNRLSCLVNHPIVAATFRLLGCLTTPTIHDDQVTPQPFNHIAIPPCSAFFEVSQLIFQPPCNTSAHLAPASQRPGTPSILQRSRVLLTSLSSSKQMALWRAPLSMSGSASSRCCDLRRRGSSSKSMAPSRIMP